MYVSVPWLDTDGSTINKRKARLIYMGNISSSN